MSEKFAQHPQHILIVRLSAIGDIIMASSVIPALRQTYPQAKISWLVQKEAADLLRANSDLEKVIVWPRSEWSKLWKQRQWLKLLKEIRGFRKSLRAHNFDLAIDLQGLFKSALMVYFTGAQKRLGFSSREGSNWMMTEVIEKKRDDPRLGSEYCDLARHLNPQLKRFPMSIQYNAEDQRTAQSIIHALNIPSGQFVALCPFTTRPQKHWVDDYWKELILQLEQRWNRYTVILGGPNDRDYAQTLIPAQAQQCFNLAGQTRLRQAASVIAQAQLLIGVDTGLTHLGTAMNTPTLALFGSTRPYLETESPLTEVIYLPRPCSPCRRSPTCNGRFDCMREVTVDRVLERVAEHIKRAA